MSIDDSSYGAETSANPSSESSLTGMGASYECDLRSTRRRLGESLVREEKLICEKEATIHQLEVLGDLLACGPNAANRIAALTSREREVMDLMLAGHANKIIAATIHLSQRTVESHRASVMKKTGSKSIAALARLAIAAALMGPSREWSVPGLGRLQFVG